MRISKYILIVASVAGTLFCASCQKEIENEADRCILTFNVTVNDSGEIEGTKSGMEEKLGWTVPVTAIETKGTLINTSGDNADLEGFGFTKFKAVGWNSDHSQFFPLSEVKYNSSIWTTEKYYEWTDMDEKVFSAYANLPETGAEVTCTESGQTFAYTAVPADARNQNDILLGYYAGNGMKSGKGGIATIQFNHPLTAVIFKQGHIEGCTGIKSISINNLYQSGSATVNYSKSGIGYTPVYEWTFSGSQTCVLAPKSGESVLEVDSTTKIIGEPFIILPQNLGNQAADVLISISTTEGDKVLKARINSGEWKEGYSYTYVLGYYDGDIIFQIEDEQGNPINSMSFINTSAESTQQIKVKSYKDVGGTKTALDYKAWYSIDGLNPTDPRKVWTAFPGTVSPAGDTGLSGFTAEGNTGSIEGIQVSVTAAGRGEGSPITHDWTYDHISGDGWDLSKCRIGGEFSMDQPSNTANCYIVKHPGTYKFPCVYGNSIQNGAVTDKGYHRSDKPNDIVLQTFYNAKGNPISNAYILKDLAGSLTKPAAALLWCDETGSIDMIQNVILNYDKDQPENATISFNTAQREKLKQCNAVIALYDDDNGTPGFQYYKSTSETIIPDKVLWSWHIWITDDKLEGSDAVRTRKGEAGKVGGVEGTSAKFMSRYLGWCDNANARHYPSTYERIDIRFQQTNGPVEYDYHYLTVYEPDSEVLDGFFTVYQNGRKDPFVSRTNIRDNTEKGLKWGDGTSGSIVCKQNSVFTAKSKDIIYQSINNPGVFCTQEDMDCSFCNLWSISLNNVSSTEEVQNLPVQKTIYDPCPYGYVVPNLNAFRHFTSDGKDQPAANVLGVWDEDRNAWIFRNYENLPDQKLTFFLNGQRNQWGGLIYAGEYGQCNCASLALIGNGTDFWYNKGTGVYPSGGDKRGRGLAIRPVLENGQE